MSVKVKGITWLVVHSSRFAEMCRFYEDVLGLTRVLDQPGAAAFRLANGDMLELFEVDPGNPGPFTTGPVPGFEVDDVAGTRSEMEMAGIEFIGPVKTGTDGSQWSHFRAPDGKIHEITKRADDKKEWDKPGPTPASLGLGQSGYTDTATTLR